MLYLSHSFPYLQRVPQELFSVIWNIFIELDLLSSFINFSIFREYHRKRNLSMSADSVFTPGAPDRSRSSTIPVGRPNMARSMETVPQPGFTVRHYYYCYCYYHYYHYCYHLSSLITLMSHECQGVSKSLVTQLFVQANNIENVKYYWPFVWGIHIHSKGHVPVNIYHNVPELDQKCSDAVSMGMIPALL